MINLHEVTTAHRSLNSGQTPIDHTPQVLSSLLAWLDHHENHHEFKQIYVFGDSLSDVENCFTITQAVLGSGLPPSPPYAQGRFSDGLVWVEYLAHLLNISSDRHSNFATGGANTGSTNTYLPNDPAHLPGLQQQIDHFVASLNSRSTNSKALYIVWAGANDYLGGGATDPTHVIANLIHAVQSLAAVGARHILVANLPDLGNLPAVRTEQSVPLNALTQAHNSGLAAALQLLEQSMASQTQITLFDVNSLFKHVFSNPENFGFTNVTDIELDQFAHFQGYTDKFFFWDAIHPTTAVHSILAKAAFDLLQPTTLSPTA